MTEMTDNTVMTVGDGLIWAGASLEEAELEEPVREAEYLLAALLDYTKGDLYLNRTRRMSGAESRAFRSAVERRSSGEPPQYIVGEQEFRGLAFKVNSDVLIPRPETELLVEELIETLREAGGELAGWGACMILLKSLPSSSISVPGAAVSPSRLHTKSRR